MESLIAAALSDIRLVWAMYALLSLLAYLCWWQALVTAQWSPLMQAILLWPLWVGLCSMAPVAFDSVEFAPALAVTLFALFSDDDILLEQLGLWWLVGALSATLYFLIGFILRALLARFRRGSRTG